MRRVIGFIALLAGCLLAFNVLAVGAAGGGMTVEDSIDVPEQTVTIDGAEYEIDAVAVHSPGDDIVVDVTLPDNATGYVDLYNSDEELEDNERLVESDTVTFSTSESVDNKPGTYMLILQVDGNVEQIHPVIVSGYEMTLSYPSEVEPDSSMSVTVDVESGALEDPPNGVDVIFHGNDEVIDVPAEAVNDWEYETTLDLEGVEDGDYTLYAVATGEEEVEGYTVSLGATTGDTVTVTSDAGSGGGGGASPPDDGDDEEEEDGDDESETDEDESETEDDESETDEDTEEESEESDDESEESDDGIIEPNGDTDDPDGVDDEQSLSLLVPLVSLLLVAVGIGLRRW